MIRIPDPIVRRPARPEAEQPEGRQLLALLSRARRRWRLRMALRGLGIVLLGAVAILVLSAWALEWGRWDADTIVAVRIFAWIALLGLAARFIAVPLLQRVPDGRVALYLEEHEPALDATLLSAVEEANAGDAGPRGGRSPALAGRLVHSALEGARRAQARDPERRGLREASALIAGAAVTAIALVLLGPAALRQGARLLAPPWSSAEASEVLAVTVLPGNARLARGGDQEITARLRGFATEEAELAVRRTATGAWERIPMSAGSDSTEFAARLFDLEEATQYFVEAGGVRSPVYTLEVANLPAVRRLDLEYRYPSYTGLAPQRVEDGGDVAAVAGTVVRVRATPTMPVRAGRLIVDGEEPIAMTVDSAGALSGELRVRRPGFYRVELQAADGGMVRGSLDYAIDVLTDGAPTVLFRTPGRDMRVTSLEEVFAEVVAEDDYGVRSLELVYAVNGGREQSVALHRDGGRPRKEVSAGHTFYLEEFGLQPGDVVSYFARAKDAGTTTATDIYFMEVRPFEKEYRQAEQGGAQPPGQAGGEDESPSALSQRQREIVAATFKVVRDSTQLSLTERRDNLSTIALAQGTLRERVETLARRMAQRGLLGADSAFQTIAEELPKAAAAMQEAEERLGRRLPSEAMPHEQKALQHLQRAEAAYREVQVSFGQQQGEGGGQPQNPDELSDLFDLDVDRMRNQYESVQRGGRSEQNDRAVDETLEKLRALAARQQQENERAARRAQAMQRSGGSSGGGSQRQLAEETEQLGRQLERLARERQSTELAETARRLQDAAAAMRRSAATGRDASTAEGAAALDRLQDARRLLDRERDGRLERDAREAQRRADDLAERQREIASDVNRLRSGSGDAELARRLTERKDALARDIEQLEGQLDRLSRDARRDEREAARGFGEAASQLRERRVPDKVRYSRGTMRGASAEYARSFEEQIGQDLEDTRRRVNEAAGAIGQASGESRSAQALDRARDLARGLESLRDRAGGRSDSAGAASGSRQGSEPQGGQQQGAQPGQQQGGQPGQQQAQGQQGGQPGGEARGTNPGQLGGSGQGAAIGGARGALTEEQIRQYSREYRERRQSAEALRRELGGMGVDAAQLDAIIRQMRELESGRAYSDTEELARLQAAVVEGFKEFEFALRRQLSTDNTNGPVLGGSAEVAERYRALVEEYYRSLGRGRQ